MSIINDLEGQNRGVYSGCIGHISADGSADLNIVIRTAVLSNGQISLGSGGAITALSSPEAEVAEVELKAAAVAGAIGYSVRFREDDAKKSPKTEDSSLQNKIDLHTV
jgi:anthranilate/para-aminobenzoate synthase component I